MEMILVVIMHGVNLLTAITSRVATFALCTVKGSNHCGEFGMGCSLELIKCEHFIEKVVRHKLGTFIQCLTKCKETVY